MGNVWMESRQRVVFMFFKSVATLNGRCEQTMYCLNTKFSSEIPFSERDKMIWLLFNVQNKITKIVNGEGVYIVFPLGRSLKINTIHLTIQFWKNCSARECAGIWKWDSPQFLQNWLNRSDKRKEGTTYLYWIAYVQN